jgi:hypothetical protein
MGYVAQTLAPGRGSGRLLHGEPLVLDLVSGSLEAVELPSLFNGANVMAIRSNAGAWEIIQFAKAEEIAAGRWRLSGLLRGQAGTEDQMVHGAPVGAEIVLLNEHVQPAGLRDGERGLELQWRIGPSGKEVDGRFFRTFTAIGGERGLVPLSPVHLRHAWHADGSLRLSWIRRSRINADSWQGIDVPVGETDEAYQISLAANETELFSEMTSVSTLVIPSASAAGFPQSLQVTIRQISDAVGPGLPLTEQIIL